MRGDQFVKEYRKRSRRQVPVVILSGAPRAYEIGKSLRACAVLAKPVEVDELIGTIRLFARPGGDAPHAAAGVRG